MADASATYTLNFADNFTAQAQAAVGVTNQLADALGRLQGATTAATASVKATAQGATAALGQVGNAAKGAGAGAKGAGVNLRALGGVLTRTGGEAGSFLGSGVRVVALLGRLARSPAGVALAVAAMSLALVAGVIAFTAYALSAADAARSQGLLAEAATGSAEAGAALVGQASRLSSVTGLSASKIRELGLSLARAGLSGQALGSSLEMVAIATSTMGDAAGQKLASIAEGAQKTKSIALSDLKLQGTGVGLNDVASALAEKMNVSFASAKAALQDGRVKVGTALDALNDAVNEKLGGIAKKQSIGLGVQLARLEENFKGLFAGLNIEPFLHALSEVTGLLDQNTVSGRGAAAAFKGIAQPLIDGFAALLPLAKPFFQGLIIVALQFAIVMLKVRNAVREAFAGVSADDALSASLIAGKVAGVSLLVVLGLLAAAVTIVAIGMAAVGLAIALPFILAGLAIYGLYSAAVAAWDAISGLDFAELGSALVDGIVNGIKSGAGAVVDAVTGLASSASAAFRNALGIHSPSTVFAAFGVNTAAGYAQGVDAGSDEATAAVARMVSLPEAPGGSTTNNRTSASRSITIAPGAIVINGVKGAEDIGDDFITRLANAFERALDSIGAPDLEPAGAS